MKTTSFSLKLPEYVKSLNLNVVVHSHGWVFLKTFYWDENPRSLHKCDNLSTKKKITWSIRKESKSLKQISIHSNDKLERNGQPINREPIEAPVSGKVNT
jgi:hypothetical protein